MHSDKLRHRQKRFLFALNQVNAGNNVELYIYDAIAFILGLKQITDENRASESDYTVISSFLEADEEGFACYDYDSIVDFLKAIKYDGISENLYTILYYVYSFNELKIDHDYKSTMSKVYDANEEREHASNYENKKVETWEDLREAIRDLRYLEERLEEIVIKLKYGNNNSRER